MKTLIKYTAILSLGLLFACNSGSKKTEVQENLGLNIGETLPNIELPGLVKKQLNLKSYRGKIVLVDFWASWCKPCRATNKKLVEIYPHYKNQKYKNANGFEIVQISFDGGKDPNKKQEHFEKWKNAVAADSIPWMNHASDLKGWESPLINTFMIDYIPYSYLIDANGKIIGKDLSVEEIENKLVELIK